MRIGNHDLTENQWAQITNRAKKLDDDHVSLSNVEQEVAEGLVANSPEPDTNLLVRNVIQELIRLEAEYDLLRQQPVIPPPPKPNPPKPNPLPPAGTDFNPNPLEGNAVLRFEEGNCSVNEITIQKDEALKVIEFVKSSSSTKDIMLEGDASATGNDPINNLITFKRNINNLGLFLYGLSQKNPGKKFGAIIYVQDTKLYVTDVNYDEAHNLLTYKVFDQANNVYEGIDGLALPFQREVNFEVYELPRNQVSKGQMINYGKANSQGQVNRNKRKSTITLK